MDNSQSSNSSRRIGRALPEIPVTAALNRSPSRSPSKATPLTSPEKDNPFESELFTTPRRNMDNPYFTSPTPSPTRGMGGHRRFESHIDSPFGSKMSSPVRRLQFDDQGEDDSVIELQDSQQSHRNSAITLAEPLDKADTDSDGFNDDIEDYGGRSLTELFSSQTRGDDYDDAQTLSSDEVPKFQPRRNKSTSRKQVKLLDGNLVLDCPVPSKLYSFLPRRDSDEFVYMRYSACTSDPDDFAEAGFTIRPAIYQRDTEICICITMYNEDEVLFTRTLHAVFKNIAYLCQRERSKVWGPEGWKRIVVSIVSDGRGKVNPRVLDCLAAMGVYQDGVAKNYVNGKEVQAHVFEYTAQVSLTPDMRFQGAEKQIVPVQMIFCLKEKNAKKINSHRWLFNALCPQINPNVVVLLDVGTRPTTPTLYHLWKAFDEDSNVAGACGEIKTMTGRFGKSLLNPLVAAQNFEYKISNILDKPFESVFGYVSVLPGALSAYRFRALENGPDGTGPLASYFKGETVEQADAGIFEKNMYLAEDRILCWELVAKQNEKWVLKYVKSAQGETDVPESLAEFMSQRRRWLNGALFAAIYSLTHFKQIWGTDHSTVRKFFFHVEFFYQLLSLLFTYFSIANFYLAFYFVAGSVAGDNAGSIPNGGGLALFLIFKYVCIITICAQFILSLGNRPQGARILFLSTVISLAIVTAYVTILGLYFVGRTFAVSPDNDDYNIHLLITLIVSLLSTYGLYTVMSFAYLDPWHIFTSGLQYFLLLPSYVCTLQIYAFCNTHDCTWGTKGENSPPQNLGAAVVKKEIGGDIVEVEMPSEQIDIDTGYDNALHSLREGTPIPPSPPDAELIKMDYFREIRTRVVLVWMTSNLIMVMLVTQFFSIDNPGTNVYLQIILWSMAVFAVFRATGSTVYLLTRLARDLHKTHYHTQRWWNKYVKKVDAPVF